MQTISYIISTLLKQGLTMIMGRERRQEKKARTTAEREDRNPTVLTYSAARVEHFELPLSIKGRSAKVNP